MLNMNFDAPLKGDCSKQTASGLVFLAASESLVCQDCLRTLIIQH